MACSPNSPQVGHVVRYKENGVIYDATVTHVDSITTVDLDVAGLGARNNIQHSPCATNGHWGCPSESCPNGGVWTSGSDADIKLPVFHYEADGSSIVDGRWRRLPDAPRKRDE
jgi:hypothetical protein